jgi:hypothetical protein
MQDVLYSRLRTPPYDALMDILMRMSLDEILTETCLLVKNAVKNLMTYGSSVTTHQTFIGKYMSKYTRSYTFSYRIRGGRSGIGADFLRIRPFDVPIFIPLIAPRLLIIISSPLYIFRNERVGK